MLENHILITLKFEADGRINFSNKAGVSSQSTQQVSLEKARLQSSKCSDWYFPKMVSGVGKYEFFICIKIVL